MATDTAATPAAPGTANPPPTIENRLMNFLGTEEATVADPEAGPQDVGARTDAAPEPDGQATDELTADDLPDETPPAAPDGDVIEFEAAGEKLRLPRSEVIKLAQQGHDYTRKTMALAEQARAVQERLQRVTQIEQVAPQLQQAHATVIALQAQLAPFQRVDWVKLATDDPLEYSKVRAQYDTLAQAHQQAAGQYGQLREAIQQQADVMRQQSVQVEAQKLVERIPEWKDPAKYKSGANALREYLIAEGAAPEEVDALNSSVAVTIAWKAMQYDQLRKAKSEKSKLLRTAPPVTRPGAGTSSADAKATQQNDLRSRLRKSGDLKDAAALLMTRMK